MYYTINVSLSGKHFFATSKRSLTDYNKAVEVYRELQNRFKASEGFSVTINKHSESSKLMSI